ncbi:MAG: 2-hydroxyacid dehydrogenase [Ruminococcaceae bacterium]|nr:2-hydroxyacid dehydrogenase [Oscillospiraceae bacterium]
MKKIAFFDAKPYDKIYFDKYKNDYGFDIKYIEYKLGTDTAYMSKKYDAVCAFVNDDINSEVIDTLYQNDINIIALRCAGYNNVDFKSAYGKVHIARVPAYSPYAVAEHTMALLLSLNRKIHKAYNRTREYNFSLTSLIGFDLYGKTIGIVGTGKIGRAFINICKGFNLNIIAYDPYPLENSDIEYVSFDELCRRSDIISLHCPLTKDTKYIINENSISNMKDNVYILNTSRGSLIDSEALLNGLRSKKVGAAGLDVYEEETDLFYEDFSYQVISDDILSGLISMPNVIVTSHQAFLTHEALSNIARITLENIKAYFDETPLKNEICYKCSKGEKCNKEKNKNCF